MHYIDYGLGIFRRESFESMEDETVKDLAEVYQELLSRKDLAAYEMKERFYEIGSFTGIEDLSAALASGVVQNPGNAVS
jgi:NDP-sugar pyrophosphorylase family protein